MTGKRDALWRIINKRQEKSSITTYSERRMRLLNLRKSHLVLFKEGAGF